jgi:asparagine synthase (glutamine-hydrolysing)
MCGICGIYEAGAPVDAGTIAAMAAVMRHRGPDDQGVYTAPGIGLGHRRLSIIDLASGHQPLCNEDGTVWVAFNGEIYNFEELNRQFLSTGHQFRSRSDTETIVHMYEELGEACFAELRGMFAIALWDARRQRLILARDRLGKKPLFYSWNGRRLVFGSEIKGMRAAGDFDAETDLEALSDFFSYGYIPAPKTIYRRVRKLRPAHYLVVENGSIRETPYWDISFAQTGQRSEREWCERFLEEYKQCVRMRLVSDVPLGAFLSGGVDSSSVVAVMNEFQRPVTTCSIGFAEQEYDESAAARAFAGSVGANHFEHRVRPNAMELLPTLAWHYDEPFADSSAVPTYYVSQVARQHVTVALSGDGGDENFAGYRRYRLTASEQRLRECMPALIRRRIFGPLGEWYPKLGWAPRVFRAKSTFQSLARDLVDGYFHGVTCYCPPELKSTLFSGDAVRALNGYDSADVLRYHYERADSTDPLSRIQYVDIKTYLVDDILTKVDRASMANSLEVRCPLLDHKLMELIAQIPSNLKLRNGRGKYIFKKALEGIVPSDTLYRPKKGFAVPVAEWFRGELNEFAHDALFGRDHELLNRAFLSRCWTEHLRGRRDWSALLWSVLMFRTWETACARQEVYTTA